MWFSGDAQIQRETLFLVKNIGPNKITWKPGAKPYAPALDVNPWSFAYAATRVSALGAKVGLRGQLAGSGLSVAALAYLLRHAPPGPTPPSLRLHSEFFLLKDFVGTSLKGNIGAAFAFINMQDRGYVWSGHFEDCVTATPIGAHPDFVFANSTDVCLVDGKGSASSIPKIELKVKAEWRRQIRPWIATPMKFGGLPTEGRVIASAMSISAGMHLVTAHGQFQPPAPVGGSVALPRTRAVESVQLANYVDACLLLGRDDLAQQMSDRRREALGVVVAIWLGDGDQKIDDGEQVYLGTPRLALQGEREQWSMQPFCRAHILNAAVRKFSGELPDLDIPATQALVPPAPRDGMEDRLDRVIVQSRDGVGALFRRVSL